MSKPFAHGLIVGKFYPPHVGHLALVRKAASECRSVTVVVAAASWESLPLELRVEWMGWEVASMPNVSIVGAMDDHPVDYDDPRIWDAHMAVFESVVAEAQPGTPVDAVFTAEDYGEEMARRLGATHVRMRRPEHRPSGTSVRSDPRSRWGDIVPAAQAGLAYRIAVVGAESTGTTTLARALADHYVAEFVPEFGRTYSAAKLAAARRRTRTNGEPDPGLSDLAWSSPEFTLIAARQTAAIGYAGTVGPIVIADTDALATSVWHDRYVGGPHHPALDLAVQVPVDLYLLTTPDGVPFVDDGLRDGEHQRERMTTAFETQLRASGCPWESLSGSFEERFSSAAGCVDRVLAQPRFPLSDAAGAAPSRADLAGRSKGPAGHVHQEGRTR